MSRALLTLALPSALLAAACGAAPETPGRPTIEMLRERAEDRPRDPDAQRELAIGEMLMQGGDAGRVTAQLERALALAPEDARLRYLLGEAYEIKGHPGAALQHYLDALDAAATSPRGATDGFVAEASAKAIEDLMDVVPRWAETIGPRLAARDGEPGNIGAAARHIVGRMRTELAYRAGDADAVARLTADHGCITQMRVAGPFGPHDLLGFDRQLSPERGEGALEDAYDLGPGRGRRPTREVAGRGCAVLLGMGPVAGGGSTFAEGVVEVPEAGEYVVRLETPNSVELFVDGESVARLDHRGRPTVRVTFHRVALEAGEHRITAKVTTRHPNPVLAIAVTDDAGRSLAAAGRAPAFELGRPDRGGPFGAYLRASVAQARGDLVGARQALRDELPPRLASAAMMMRAAEIALGDPLTPPDVGRDRARRYLRIAQRRDPDAWEPLLSLAQLDAAEGRIPAALEVLARVERRFPEVVEIPLTRAELFLARGWEAQAEREFEKAHAVAPDSCATLRGTFAAAERRLRAEEMGRLAERLVECDARSTVRFQLKLRSRDWDGAAAELDRIARLEPPQSQYGILSSRLEVARGRADREAIAELLGEMAALQPQSMLTHVDRADQLLAGGDRAAAARTLSEAIEAEPSALAELRLVRRALTGDLALSDFRKDGAEVIRAFEASGRSYEEPEVLVLDYTVVRLFDDGSTLELTHNIWRVQADEALDERGEFSPPPGARVLTLHTVKAEDGRRIEADYIEGKDSISLPQLETGDYVEYEYVRAQEAASGFPDGYLGDRFYFRSFETPYDLSQLTLVMPASMEPVIDPRGPAPEAETRVEDGLRVLRFTERESRPREPEASSVAPKEYVPSINVGVNVSWEVFAEGLVDALADRDVRDPALAGVVARILGGARDESAEARARRLYRWVLDNIENNNDVFGLASSMVYDRTGNRGRVLHYLLALAGVDADLVLASTLAGDQTRSALPDAEVYQYLLVRIGEGDDAVFLSTVDRGAPFGYIPPILRGQDALVLGPGAERVRVPETRRGSDLRTIDAEVRVRENGSAQVEVVEAFRGAPAVGWRADLEGVPAAVLEERFEEGYVARLVPGAELSSLRITGREDPTVPLTFRYTFEVRAIGTRRSGDLVLPGLFPTQLSPVYARLSERTTTQVVAPGAEVDVTLRVIPPEGTNPPAALPAARASGPGGASFTSESERADGALVVSRKVRVPIMRVSPEEYGAFARFCRSVDEAEARQIRVPL